MKKSYKVYTKEGCTFCVKVLNLFKLVELSFVQIKLTEDISIEDFKNKFPTIKTFPLITVVEENSENEDIIGGSIEFVNYLKENKLI